VPSFKHYNSRGDVISATDATGAATWQGTYEAFGTRTQEVGTTQDRQKANTKEEDPTGLLNEGFRYRDLETGVFITRDPLGFVDGPNMYAYVVQNPWSKFDPEGLALQELAPIINEIRQSPPQVQAFEVGALVVVAAFIGAHELGDKVIGPALANALNGSPESWRKQPSSSQFTKGHSFDIHDDEDADAAGRATSQRQNGDHAGAEATLRNRINQRSSNSSINESSKQISDENAGKTSVYQREDGYIGITNDFSRRQKEWAREGHVITELHQTPDRETARGVEQKLIEDGRAKGNKANKEQNNSIDPSRTDERANRMREKGREFLDKNKKKEDK
jgi:RHS repeat-associated protein